MIEVHLSEDNEDWLNQKRLAQGKKGQAEKVARQYVARRDKASVYKTPWRRSSAPSVSGPKTK